MSRFFTSGPAFTVITCPSGPLTVTCLVAMSTFSTVAVTWTTLENPPDGLVSSAAPAAAVHRRSTLAASATIPERFIVCSLLDVGMYGYDAPRAAPVHRPCPAGGPDATLPGRPARRPPLESPTRLPAPCRGARGRRGSRGSSRPPRARPRRG